MIGLTKEGESPEQAAARLSMTLAGLEIAPATYERRGLFGFVETDAAADTAASYGTAYEEMQVRRKVPLGAGRRMDVVVWGGVHSQPVCYRGADCGAPANTIDPFRLPPTPPPPQLVCDREADCGLEPVETELFTPLGWVPFVAVPYDQMPADDAIWYPKLLPVAGASFGGPMTSTSI